MTDDEQPRRLRILLYCVIIAAVVAGLWFSRPLYRSWKSQRALAQAVEFLKKSDFKNANLSARQVLAYTPQNPGALQVMASIAAQLRSPETIAWRQRLVDVDPDDPTNRIALAEAALMFGDPARAEQNLMRVAPSNRQNAAFHKAAAMLLASQRKLTEAEAHFRAAMKLEPTNQLLQLNHAVILIQAADSNVVQAGIENLQKFTKDPSLRRMALQNLAQAWLHSQNFDKAISTARELADDKNATFGDRMLLLDILRTAKSLEYSQQLESIKKAANAAGPEQVQSLASWLIATGQIQPALDWLASLPAELQSKQRVSMALADLHQARGDWPSLQKLTESASWGDADFLRHAMLARACREQHQSISADSAWLAAVRATAGNPKAIAALARMASTWGWQHEEEDLLWTLVERHPGERRAPGTLKETLTKAGDTRGLNRLASVLVNQNPNNFVAKNDLAGTSLLLGVQTARAHELAREVFSKFPSNEITASTYAFSLYLQGKSPEALRAFAAVPTQALEQPSIALYYGMVLGTNSPTDARKYLDLAAKGNLLREEKALLDETRRKL